MRRDEQWKREMRMDEQWERDDEGGEKGDIDEGENRGTRGETQG